MHPEAAPIDLEHYVPFFITAISNRWTASSSALYRKQFNIGVVDWRIIVSLQVLGDASSLDCVNLVGLDPGAVSRSIRQMETRGIVMPTPGRFAGRTKPYRLTDAGQALYEQISGQALEQERVLLQDLDDGERQQLIELLRRVHRRTSELSSG